MRSPGTMESVMRAGLPASGRVLAQKMRAAARRAARSQNQRTRPGSCDADKNLVSVRTLPHAPLLTGAP